MYDMKKYEEEDKNILKEGNLENQENLDNQENMDNQEDQNKNEEDLNMDGLDDIPLDQDNAEEEEVEVVDKLKPKVRVYDDESRNRAFLNKNKREYNEGLNRVQKLKQ